LIQVALIFPSEAKSLEILKKSFYEGYSGMLAIKVSCVLLFLDQSLIVILSLKKGAKTGKHSLALNTGFTFSSITLVA
jgi:hypothetical protein